MVEFLNSIMHIIFNDGESGVIDFGPAVDMVYKILKPVLIAGGSLLVCFFTARLGIIAYKMNHAESDEEKANIKKNIGWMILGLVVGVALIPIGSTLRQIIESAMSNN